MKKKNKGFTLIELLAVIVILGLLMAIAIPSVTKYITQSRKKTVTTTIGNYISALTNQVNDMEYVFTEANTVYAVPIECIALERGGTNPFGEWMQASDSYWAYVLVQYNDSTSSYTYGFTFKDSAGYGLYPTTSEKLNENGSQVQTGLNLTRPTSGTIANITAKANWTGFDIEDDTNLVVLEAESEWTPGDGKTTCTLCQKGDNYDSVEKEKEINKLPKLNNLIKNDNTLIDKEPNLKSSTAVNGDSSGLYVSNDTNSGQPTFYFRGNVTNNYVSFAGLTWKIIRINEDDTIRLILNDRINNTTYSFNTIKNDFSYMYYSNSDTIKPTIDAWYKTNIIDKGYDKYVATATFCEQAKVKYDKNYTSGNATMDSYSNNPTPNFKCATDGNGKGILNSKVGTITYDEAMFAGSHSWNNNNNHYLCDLPLFYTMGPAGYNSTRSYAVAWYVHINGRLQSNSSINSKYYLRPVINLLSNAKATGTGTSSDPYVIQTN